MERKLVKQGRSAMTVTLPSKWIKKNNLLNGGSVDVEEENGKLIISSKSGYEKKNITLDLRDCERGYAFHILIGKYIEGYDKIIVKHNNLKLAKEMNATLIGMVTENLDENEIVFRNIINTPEDNFSEVFKRSCQLLIHQARTLMKIIDKESTFREIKKDERILDHNIFYCQRYINKYEKVHNAHQYFLLTTTIESVGDLISNIAKFIEWGKCSREDKKNIENLVLGIEEYVLCLFRNDFHRMYKSLRKFRNSLETNSMISGLSYAIAEELYNYIGFLVVDDKK